MIPIDRFGVDPYFCSGYEACGDTVFSVYRVSYIEFVVAVTEVGFRVSDFHDYFSRMADMLFSILLG